MAGAILYGLVYAWPQLRKSSLTRWSGNDRQWVLLCMVLYMALCMVSCSCADRCLDRWSSDDRKLMLLCMVDDQQPIPPCMVLDMLDCSRAKSRLNLSSSDDQQQTLLCMVSGMLGCSRAKSRIELSNGNDQRPMPPCIVLCLLGCSCADHHLD